MELELLTPIAQPVAVYKAEENPYKQLHRLVDVYETIIKYLVVIAI